MNISDILDKRVNTRCFSNEPIPAEYIKEMLEVLNRIPVKSNEVPTEIIILGEKATRIKEEFYKNTECEVNVYNPQVLAPLVFCFCLKSDMQNGDGQRDPSISDAYVVELHRMHAGMASMAIAISALDSGLGVGFCQSAGRDDWPDIKERGGTLTLPDGTKKHVTLSLGVGYPLHKEEPKLSRVRMRPEEAQQRSRKFVKLSANNETNKRPELNSYIRILGQKNIWLPDTWQNTPLLD